MVFADSLKSFEQLLDVSSPKSMSLKEQETLYSAAFGLYEIGNYPRACDLFGKLVLHNPYEIRFWKGVASTQQMQKNYREALHAWAITSLLSGHEPSAHFHAAECYLSLGEIEEAKKALKCAQLHLKEENPLFGKIKQLNFQVENG